MIKRIKNLFAGVRRSKPPFKESSMSDQQAQTTNPATPAGNAGEPIDTQAITEAAVKAATEAVNAAVKPLTDRVASLSEAVGKAATAEQVAEQVEAKTAELTRSFDEKVSAAQNQQAASAQRAQYIQEKMTDVPEAYLGKLGDDPSKWDTEQQAIRSQLKTDLEKLGVKREDVGGDKGGQKPTSQVDTSKLSGIDLIQQGVAQTATNPSLPNSSSAAASQESPKTD